MADRLIGKTALVTGGGNGIGRASSIAFSSEGANVVIADIVKEAAADVAAEIASSGGSAIPVEGDVGKEEEVDAIIRAGLNRFDRIDVVLNCAGGGSIRDGPVTDLALDEFWRTIRVDLFGTLLVCRRVIPEMVAAGGGSIINVSSLRALIGTSGADAYTASKGGIVSMSRAMAMQWAGNGIRVNVMAPGVVLTERVASFVKPGNPIYEKSLLGPSDPVDVANLALFLASDESRMITGALMRVDGGASSY